MKSGKAFVSEDGNAIISKKKGRGASRNLRTLYTLHDQVRIKKGGLEIERPVAKRARNAFPGLFEHNVRKGIRESAARKLKMKRVK